MKTLTKQMPNHSLNELAQGFECILEKNRELLTVDELKLCYNVLELIELDRNESSKERLRVIASNVASILLRLFLDVDLIKTLSKFL